MKTVLILGAGTTRAAAGNVRSKARRPPLDTDFFEIAQAAEPELAEAVLDCLQGLVGDYSENIARSLEAATTYLYIKAIDDRRRGVYHRAFISLLNLINRTLVATTNRIKVGPRSGIYRFLLSELRRVDEDLTLITFNYDLLLERVMEEIAVHGNENAFVFPGCYRLPKVNSVPGVEGYPGFRRRGVDPMGTAILKMHGSINWQSTHNSATPPPAAMFSPDRTLHVVDSPLAHTLTWRRKKRRTYMKPVIVPPISGKRGMMHNIMPKIWEKAATALRKADRVVIAGYSCPPLDLEARILLSENLRWNEDKRVYVINPNTEVTSRFVDLCGVNHATVYASIGDWTDDAAKYPNSG